MRAPQTPGTYYVGACVEYVSREDLGIRLDHCSNGVEVTVTGAVESDDRLVLEALYNATDGPNWWQNNFWLTDEPLEHWVGVYTDVNGRVAGLSLVDNNLSGRIPNTLGSLTKLDHLYLDRNALSGPIPGTLGSLVNLGILNLGENALSGAIPVTLGNLTNLGELSLYANQLSGVIPAALGNLTNVELLYLDRNALSGPIPAELGALANLTHLGLHENRLSGPIPAELGALVNLEYLSLDSQTGLCLASDFLLTSAFARLAQDEGVGVCDDTGSGFTDDPIVAGVTRGQGDSLQ